MSTLKMTADGSSVIQSTEEALQALYIELRADLESAISENRRIMLFTFKEEPSKGLKLSGNPDLMDFDRVRGCLQEVEVKTFLAALGLRPQAGQSE